MDYNLPFASEIMAEFKKFNVEPNEETYAHLISCSCRAGSLERALSTLEAVKREGMRVSSIHFMPIGLLFLRRKNFKGVQSILQQMASLGHSTARLEYLLFARQDESLVESYRQNTPTQ